MSHSVVPRRWQIRSTIAIIGLSAVSSLLGLFREGHYTDMQALLSRITAEDIVVLVVAVPVLAGGLWLVARGSRRGRLVWLGSLAYMTYMWGTIGLNRSFNAFFLGYVVLFALSLYTFVGALLDTNPGRYHRTLTGRRRLVYAAFLLVTAAGLGVLWISDIVPALLAGRVPGVIEQFGELGIVTYVFDLGVVVPALALTARWLWRDHEWGDACAGVLLVFAALLAPGISAITLVDLQSGVEMTTGMVVGSVLPPLLGGLFALDFLRQIPSQRGRDREEGTSLTT